MDTGNLPEELSNELETLVHICGVFDFETSPAPNNYPDVISYVLSVTDEGRTKSLSVNDVSAGTLHPLLTRLRLLALNQGKDRFT